MNAGQEKNIQKVSDKVESNTSRLNVLDNAPIRIENLENEI